MSDLGTSCTLVLCFKVAEGKMDAFKEGAQQLVERTKSESPCIFYLYSFNGDIAQVREAYADAAGVLSHIEHVTDLLEETIKICEIARLEVHGPDSELAKLREPLKGLNPEFYSLELGFRNYTV